MRRPARQDGYSLVELMVAVTVFALVFAAVSLGIGRALEISRSNRNRSAGAYLAARQLEEVRSKAFDQVALGRTTCVYSSPGPNCNVPSPYTVTQDVSWTSPGSTSTSCNVPSGSGAALAYKRVTVTVTWPDMGGVAPVASQTLLTPPSGTFDPNDGHVLVQVFDRSAAPLAGQTVSLSGPESDSQPTTSDGCVFFAYLDPGTYTVSLNTTGYVGRQGDQPATQTVAVTATQISTLQFDYDRAATLQIGLNAPAGSPTAVIPSPIALTVANSNLTVGTKSFSEASTGSGATRTVTPLFPYASGYQVWAGDCADADPDGTPDLYPVTTRGLALTSNPAGTTAGTVNLGAVDVTVRQTSVTGALVRNTTVTASGIHAAGMAGCMAGETLTASPRTDGNGKLRLALPYGTWTVRVTVPGSPAKTGTFTPVAINPSTVPTATVVVV
jgi:prepilin-type N-terminal cleavage/methylation domain-containing protein